MDLTVELILAAKPAPFTVLMRLSDGTYAVSHTPLLLDEKWVRDGKEGKQRFTSYKYAKAAYDSSLN